jgi:uncharacterized protein
MKNAIIVHGKPGSREQQWREKTSNPNSKAHWLGWLKKNLEQDGVKVETPEMPEPDRPLWKLWEDKIDKSKITKDTILVGHSCGGGFWVKYLSIHKDVKPGKVILVAPWLDPDGDETRGFFDDYKMDSDITKRTEDLVIFNSDNDMGNVHKSVAQIREHIKDVEYREFHKYGHFTFAQMRTKKFPELLEECLKANT